MMKYRKKQIVVEVEAVQFLGGKVSADAIQEWAKGYGVNIIWWFNHDTLGIPTVKGTLAVNIDDWVIKNVNDEFWVVKKDVFDMTYEAVKEKKEKKKDG